MDEQHQVWKVAHPRDGETVLTTVEDASVSINEGSLMFSRQGEIVAIFNRYEWLSAVAES